MNLSRTKQEVLSILALFLAIFLVLLEEREVLGRDVVLAIGGMLMLVHDGVQNGVELFVILGGANVRLTLLGRGARSGSYGRSRAITEREAPLGMVLLDVGAAVFFAVNAVVLR